MSRSNKPTSIQATDSHEMSLLSSLEPEVEETYHTHYDTLSTHLTIFETPHKACYMHPMNWVRIIFLVALTALLITAVIEQDQTFMIVEAFFRWMRDNILVGSLVFILLIVVCTVLMVPGSMLTMGAGFVYVQILGSVDGLLVSFLVVFVGVCFGATAAFLNSRYLLRSVVESCIGKRPKYEIIDRIIRENGFKVVLLLRLSPVTPYNFLNYLCGITSVRLKDFLYAHVGMIPDTVVYSFVGGSIASLHKISKIGLGSNIPLLILTIVGSVIAVCGIIWISCVAKREYDKLADEHRRNQEDLSCAQGEGVDVQQQVNSSEKHLDVDESKSGVQVRVK